MAKHHGKILNIQTVRALSETNREGSNLLFLSDAAEKIGYRSFGVKFSVVKFQEATIPLSPHWNKEYYIINYNKKLRTISKSDYWIN